MPEGPSIVILKEAVLEFRGKKILDAWGNGKADPDGLRGQRVVDIRSLGKQLLIILKKTTVRIHLLLFGTYSINEQNRPDDRIRLALRFPTGVVYFYTCSVTELEGDPEELFDWESDVMGDRWNVAKAKKKLKLKGEMVGADALLDQSVFAGVGNIIKNEVMYRVRVHPETLVNDLPPRLLSKMISEARKYSFEFLEQKKAGTLKRNWEAHTKKICRRCELPFSKKYVGKTKRRTFYCENCQFYYYS